MEHRTLGHFINDYEHFARTPHAKPKDFRSVQRQPLILRHLPPSTRVIDVCALPWLHITLGVVNHTISKLLKAIPNAKAWPESLHLHQESYHGSGYEGNECQKLLKNVERLEDLLVNLNQIEEGQRYILVFRTFNQVNVEYSKESVQVPMLKDAVFKFEKAWRACSLPAIPKVHLIVDHLEDFVTSRGNQNMKLYAEQAHETLHSEYQRTWDRYAVKDISNPNYETSLWRSVLDYNGVHAK